ncbi:MAG: hypothetical protein ABI301_00330 [Jatrophihabitantaceae bacterium]
MIRNVKDVTALLDRRFGSAGARPLSLVRILVWVGVGLYLIGSLAPARPVDMSKTHYNAGRTANSPIFDPLLNQNDPRGWMVHKKDPSKFTIAWVGTSTMQNVRSATAGYYSFIPADVRARIPKIDGKSVHINMYLLEGGRSMDVYNAVSSAIASKPDLIMVDLNPLWVFNDRAVQEWDALNGPALGHMVEDPANWPLLAALDSPSDVALALGGTHLSSLRDRWSYAQQLHDAMANLSPLKLPSAASLAKQPPPTGLALINAWSTSLGFWNYYRPLVPSNASVGTQQEALMREDAAPGPAMSADITSTMLGALAKSKIPSVAYLSPVDPSALVNPANDAAMGRIESRLKQLADQHRSPNLLVQPQSAERFLSGLTFKDLAHMTNSKPMVDYLAGLVCSHLTAVNPATECSPKPRASTP